MSETELLIGYGSLLSKKGLTREGSAPYIHRAWGVAVPGRRGFAKTFRAGRKPVFDAFLDEARILRARPLDHYLEGQARPPRDSPDRMDEQPAFEAVMIETDAAGWQWFDEREEFPAGLGAALAAERDETGLPVAALLARVMAEAGLEGYAQALFDRYRDRLDDPEWTAFARCYVPHPLHLPPEDVAGGSLPHEWAIVCATPQKEMPVQQASVLAKRDGIDPHELLHYYHDCVLGAEHGLDVRDIRDAAFEADHPEFAPMLAAHRDDEHRPLSWFLGNLPKGALPARPEPAHDMRPLEDLVSLETALERLAAVPFARPPVETRPLDGTLGMVLAEDLHAPQDVPHFAKSAMDGYAVRAEDTFGASPAAPRHVTCIGVQHAGAPLEDLTVTSGTCVQIATGAPLPPGADAVVMVEATTRDDEVVHVHRAHARRQNVIHPGSDLRAGDRLVAAGVRLDPMRIAAVASGGIVDVRVNAHPRVAVISTGDEVVPPGRPLGPGQVHDANNHALAAYCRRVGADVTRIPGVPDEEDRLESAVMRAVEEHDVVVVTGGTSAGERDLLPRILAAHGDLLFHGIRIRPGKPVVAARLGGKLVLGLPGYTTSCLLVAEALLAPLLQRAAGEREPLGPAVVETRLAAPVSAKSGWHLFVPVRLTEDGAVPTFRGSAAVSSLLSADGYIEIPSDAAAPQVGERVVVRRFR